MDIYHALTDHVYWNGEKSIPFGSNRSVPSVQVEVFSLVNIEEKFVKIKL